MTVEIKDKLFKEIKSYCEINNLDVTEYINSLLKKEFMVDKYGERPEVLEKPKNKANEFKPVEDIKPVPLDLDKDSKLYGTKEAIKAVVEAHDKINVPEEDFNSKEMELNKALKDGVFDKELGDELPIVVEEPKKKRRKLS